MPRHALNATPTRRRAPQLLPPPARMTCSPACPRAACGRRAGSHTLARRCCRPASPRSTPSCPAAAGRPGRSIELLADRPGVGELSLLLPLLGATPPARWIVCIAPPLLPYAPALARAGVPLARLLVVRPERREDLLWAIRQALLSGSCACVLAWPQRIDNAGLRRLQLAAEESATPLFLFRPASVAAQPSPAVLRIALAPHPEGLQLRILKRRGPLAAARWCSPSQAS